MELYKDQASKNVFVTGVNWVVSDPFESMNAQIAGYISDGAKNFIKFKNGADINYGLLPDIINEKFTACHFVSVGKLAGTNHLFKGATVMLLLVNTLSADGGGIAIGILSGNIVIDCHIDNDDAVLKIEEFASLCERSSRAFKLWGNYTGINRDYDDTFTLEQLINNKKEIKKALIGPLRNNRVVLLIVAGVASVCLIAAVDMTWGWYVQMKKDVVESIRIAQLSPDAQYLKMINTFNESKQYVVTDSAEQLKAQINAIPYKVHGWTLKTVSCVLPDCTLVWVYAGGTYQDFRDGAPKEWTNITPSVGTSLIGDLKTITNTLQLKLTLSNLTTRTEWPTQEQFAWSVGSAWQKLIPLGWTGDIKPPELREIPIGVSVAAIRNHPQAIWGIPWSVSNQPIWLMDGLSQFEKNVTIQKIDLTIDEKTGVAQFNAAGIAYVKK